MSDLEEGWFGDFFVLHRPRSEPGGPRVHFAHATGFNATTYRSLIRQFDARIDAFAMDARGHGRTTAPADPAKLRSWGDHARDLTAFLESLGGPTLLSGHSMGGTVAIHIAANHPELVSGLLLIEPVVIPRSHRVRTQMTQLLGLTRFMAMPKKTLQRTMEFASRDAAIENFVGKGPFSTWPRHMVEDYVDGGTLPLEDGGVRLSCDRQWEARTFATVIPNLFHYAAKLSCPVTLMVGAERASTCRPKSRARFKEVVADLRLIEIEEATHFLPMEYPGRVCAELSLMLEPASRTAGT